MPDHCPNTFDLWRKWQNYVNGSTYAAYSLVSRAHSWVVLPGPRGNDSLCLDRLTVRCFYPLSGVNRLSVDRTFRSEAPGFGLVDIFKSLKGYTEQSKWTLIKMYLFLNKLSSADPGNGPAAEGCVMGNAVNSHSHRVHQTTASGGVGHQSSHRRDPDRQKASHPSTNYLPHPEASGIGTHQVASARDHSHSIPHGYDRLVDISLQLSNLSSQSLNFVVRGENLDLTDATLAIDSGSSKVPRHPVIGQLKIDSGQSEESRLLGPNRRVNNICRSDLNNPSSFSPGHKPHQDPQGPQSDLGMKTQNLKKRLDMEFSLFGSPDGGNHLNSEGTRGLKGQLDPLRFASPEQASSAGSQSEQSLERPGSTEWRKTGALHSKVHNVRVKPPSRFVSSVNTLRKKPLVQPLNSAPTVLSSQEHMADGVWEGKQVQTIDLDQTSIPVSPNQQMPLHKPVHSPSSQNLFYQVAGTKYDGWTGYDAALKNVQAAGRVGTALFYILHCNSWKGPSLRY